MRDATYVDGSLETFAATAKMLGEVPIFWALVRDGRAITTLDRIGVHTVQALANVEEADLEGIRGVGPKTRRIVMECVPHAKRWLERWAR